MAEKEGASMTCTTMTMVRRRLLKSPRRHLGRQRLLVVPHPKQAVMTDTRTRRSLKM